LEVALGSAANLNQDDRRASAPRADPARTRKVVLGTRARASGPRATVDDRPVPCGHSDRICPEGSVPSCFVSAANGWQARLLIHRRILCPRTKAKLRAQRSRNCRRFWIASRACWLGAGSKNNDGKRTNLPIRSKNLARKRAGRDQPSLLSHHPKTNPRNVGDNLCVPRS